MDDVDATLADLEARLRALQAELEGEDAARPSAGDPLDAFGDRLRRTAEELVAAYDETVEQARTGDGVVFDDQVALEARVELPGLCALSRALSAIPGVHAVDLRAYAGGHAALDVVLDRPVALVAELRARSAPKFGVLESRPGRLAIEVGAPGAAQDISRG